MTYQSYLKILSTKEKNKILAKLKEQFGITEVKGEIIARGAERLFLYQGSLDEKQIQELERTLPVERIGIYFAKLVPGEDKIRLSIDGANLFKNQITKNIVELNDKQADDWLHGNEILLDNPLSPNHCSTAEQAHDVPLKKINVKKSSIKAPCSCKEVEQPIKKNLSINNSSAEDSSEAESGANNREQSEPIRGFVIIKHKDDFLGTGKASAEKITNFVPKTRRLKNKE